MNEYLSYGLEFTIGFILQYAILNRNWLLAVLAVIGLFVKVANSYNDYNNTISFFVGVIAATYYINN